MVGIERFQVVTSRDFAPRGMRSWVGFGCGAPTPHGDALVLRDLEYIGTHPEASNDLNRVDVAFEDDGIAFSRRGERLGIIPWSDVNSLSAFSESVPGTVGIASVLFFAFLHFCSNGEVNAYFSEWRTSEGSGSSKWMALTSRTCARGSQTFVSAVVSDWFRRNPVWRSPRVRGARNHSCVDAASTQRAHSRVGERSRRRRSRAVWGCLEGPCSERHRRFLSWSERKPTRLDARGGERRERHPLVW